MTTSFPLFIRGNECESSVTVFVVNTFGYACTLRFSAVAKVTGPTLCQANAVEGSKDALAGGLRLFLSQRPIGFRDKPGDEGLLQLKEYDLPF